MAKRKSNKDKHNPLLKYLNLKQGFITLPFPLIESHSWQKLSKSAHSAYINILYAYWKQKEKDPRRIICPHNKLLTPMHKDTWRIATQDLEAAGFVLVLRRSGFGHGQFPNIYSLSNNWTKT